MVCVGEAQLLKSALEVVTCSWKVAGFKSRLKSVLGTSVKAPLGCCVQ